ncbi:MAG: hypothetical protein QF362_03000 [Candidatus Woesearchaeota archaeon]|jgi:hypothetical protein|nr:hypothetical protein [Candidatus Woesearchaeota archaeon]MDP7506386.1 hypothetical protein [Candidatus Woesearchaeota archaeon]|tara:strand:- start:1906 stop:2445 length:540 start_codon:yes stop_codon:yes gene_type:complete
MEIDNIKLLEELFDKKVLKVLKLFLADKGNEFYLREIAKLSKVPVASTYRIITKLIALNIIDEKKIKKFKLYKIKQNKSTEFLESFIKEDKRIVEIFVESASKMPNVESLILHGSELKDRANVLIIGENIDSNLVKNICGEIKEEYNFTVSALTLAKAQFEQMSNMGLYSGKRKTLFER